MPHKSPFNEEVYQGWEQIAFDKPRLTTEERIALWTPLFERYWKGGRLDLPADDAALITSLGWSLAMQSGNPNRALEMCDIFLALPDSKGDDASLKSHLAWRGTALILAGRVDEGISQFRQLLDGGRLALALVRSELRQLLSEDLEESTFLKVRPFAGELLRRLKKCKPLAALAANAASAQELDMILAQSVELANPKPQH